MATVKRALGRLWSISRASIVFIAWWAAMIALAVLDGSVDWRVFLWPLAGAVLGWCAAVVYHIRRPGPVELALVLVHCNACGWHQPVDSPEQIGPAIAHHTEFGCPAGSET